MTEQRDWYLSMLGINQYRQRLPGEAVFTAAARPVASSASLPQGDIPASPASGSPAGGHASQGGIMSSLADIRETLTGEKPPTKPVATLVAEVQEAIASRPVKEPLQTSPENTDQGEQPTIEEPLEVPEDISFSLACWQVSDDLLVINDFKHGERAGRVHFELLANILRAIGHLPKALPAAELIEWPLKPGADSSLAGAKTQLSMFLLGRQQVRPYRFLLVMGEESSRLLDKADVAPVPDADAAEIVFTLSLQAMLAEPLCKREVWQAVRHLRGA